MTDASQQWGLGLRRYGIFGFRAAIKRMQLLHGRAHRMREFLCGSPLTTRSRYAKWSWRDVAADGGYWFGRDIGEMLGSDQFG